MDVADRKAWLLFFVNLLLCFIACEAKPFAGSREKWGDDRFVEVANQLKWLKDSGDPRVAEAEIDAGTLIETHDYRPLSENDVLEVEKRNYRRLFGVENEKMIDERVGVGLHETNGDAQQLDENESSLPQDPKRKRRWRKRKGNKGKGKKKVAKGAPSQTTQPFTATPRTTISMGHVLSNLGVQCHTERKCRLVQYNGKTYNICKDVDVCSTLG